MNRDTLKVETFIHRRGGHTRKTEVGVRVTCLITGIAVRCIHTNSDHKNLAICSSYINDIRASIIL